MDGKPVCTSTKPESGGESIYENEMHTCRQANTVYVCVRRAGPVRIRVETKAKKKRQKDAPRQDSHMKTLDTLLICISFREKEDDTYTTKRDIHWIAVSFTRDPTSTQCKALQHWALGWA